MPFFSILDFESIERSAVRPLSLRARVDDMILGSSVCRVKVESIDPETGQYRLVIQGTLDQEPVRWRD